MVIDVADVRRAGLRVVPGFLLVLLIAVLLPAGALAVAPSPVEPADGASVTAGTSVTFRATVPDATSYESVYFYVSSSAARGADGQITPDVDSGFSSGREPAWTSQKAASRARTVYWQPSRTTCSSSPCRREAGAVRTLHITPRPAPQLDSPADGAAVERGGSVALSASLADGAPYGDSVEFRVSASPVAAADGRIGTDLARETSYSRPYGMYSSKIAARAGVIYWQAVRSECNDPGCSPRASAPRALRILPKPAPVLLSPADAAALDAGRALRVTARVKAAPAEPVRVVFARSAQTAPDGTLSDRIAEQEVEDDYAFPERVRDIEVDVPKAVRRPGIVYWQVHRTSCEDEPDCKVTSGVRSFRIRPEAVKLTATRSRRYVRITRPVFSVDLRCSTACRLEGAITATAGGRRVPALGGNFAKEMTRAGRYEVRRSFSGKRRGLLRRLVRRHRKVLVRVKATATDAEGRTSSVTRIIPVYPPYIAPPPPPPTRGCSPMTDLYTKIIRLKAQGESCGKARSVARFWQLSGACVDDSCRARGYDCTADNVESSQYVWMRRVSCSGRGSITFDQVAPSG